MHRLTLTAPLAVAAVIAMSVVAPSSAAPTTSSVGAQLALARVATAKYATNLARAKADGYQIITPMIPDMGYHFLDPKITGFNVARPPILVYVRNGTQWQLGALEWVFQKRPAKPPIPGARYGTFAAACHYLDGTFLFADSRSKCPATSPATEISCGTVAPGSQAACTAAIRATGSRLNFWHGPLITMHLWLWYPNPAGLYSDTNPLMRPFNKG